MSYDHDNNVISSDYWSKLLADPKVIIEDKLAIVSHLSYKENAVAFDKTVIEDLINGVKEEKDLTILFQDLLNLDYTDAFQSFGEAALGNFYMGDSRAPAAFLKLIATTDIQSLDKFAKIQGIDAKLDANINEFGPLFQLKGEDLIARFNILSSNLGPNSKFMQKLLNSAVAHDEQVLVNTAITKGLITKDQILQNYMQFYKSGGKEICRSMLGDFIDDGGKSDKQGNNIMHLAVMNNDYELLKEIQKLGKTDLLNEKNKSGITPLEYLAVHQLKGVNNGELADFIIKNNKEQDANLYKLAYNSGNRGFLTELLSKSAIGTDIFKGLIQESIIRKDHDSLLGFIKNYPDQYQAIQAENDYKSLVIIALKDNPDISTQILQDKHTSLDIQYTQQPLDILKFCLYENNTKLAEELIKNEKFTLKNPPTPQLIFDLVGVQSDSRDQVLSGLLSSNKINPNISINKLNKEADGKQEKVEIYMLGDLCMRGDAKLVQALLKNPDINPNVGAKLESEQKAAHPIELMQDAVLSIQMDYINSKNDNEKKQLEEKIANYHNIIAEIAAHEKSNISEVTMGGLPISTAIYFSPYVTPENKANLFEQQLKNDKGGLFLKDGENNSLLESLIIEGDLALVQDIVLPRIEKLDNEHQAALVNALIRWNKEAALATDKTAEDNILKILDEIQNKTGKSLKELTGPDLQAVHYAAASGSTKVFDYVKKQCGIDKNDISILAAAYRGANDSIIKTLEGEITNPNRVFDYKDQIGQNNIMHYLASVDQSMEKDACNVAKDASAHPIDLNAKNIVGHTPLMLAASSKNNAILDLILDKKLDIDAQDKAGNTALAVAVNSNNLHAVKGIINHGGKINIANNLNIQPLALCMELNSSGKVAGIKQEIARELIQNNADVSFQSDKKGFLAGLMSSVYALAIYTAISKVITTVSSFTIGLFVSKSVHGVIEGTAEFALAAKASSVASNITTEFIKEKFSSDKENKIDLHNLFLIGSFNRDGMGNVSHGDALRTKMEKVGAYKGLGEGQAGGAVFKLSEITDVYIEKNKHHIIQSIAIQGANVQNAINNTPIISFGKSDLTSMLSDLKSAYSMVLQKEQGKDVRAYLDHETMNQIMGNHSAKDIAAALTLADKDQKEKFTTLCNEISKGEVLVKDFGTLLKVAEINKAIEEMAAQPKTSAKHQDISKLISDVVKDNAFNNQVTNSRAHASKLKDEYENNIKDASWKNFQVASNANEALINKVADGAGALVGLGVKAAATAYSFCNSDNCAKRITLAALFSGSVAYEASGRAKDIASWGYQFCKKQVDNMKSYFAKDEQTTFIDGFNVASQGVDLSKYAIQDAALIKADDPKININLEQQAKGKYQSIIDNSKSKEAMQR